ncbi:CCAAT-binding factor [Kalmanozyma brasiliensis GHG001]|uniref:Nucleolar complex-associated protein 3 n=1 Tax=Kalmanozyma brasiliensis (strain GHG001) TaxID=1365824 RepID=V5EZS1_KALBG|nr:CCAAT-binding factor [Kalmanozyma brasiliensis GHG001]EST09443.1 CCAAT-binding factor [Kalmanozyma brasiliensis GHG001]
MPPKRKAGPSSAGSSKPAAKKPSKGRQQQQPRRPKLAQQLDMYIRRSDDEESDDEPAPSTSKAKISTNAVAQEPDYEPESDEASHVSSSGEEDSEDEDDGAVKVKTVSAANLSFLSGLDRDKAINLSQKDAKQKSKELKRSDRKEFEETRRQVAADKKAKLVAPPSEDENDDEDDFSDDSLEEEEEEVELGRKGEKQNYQEYSDVSEGEEVDASSDEEPAAPIKVTSKNTKKATADDGDAEASYLARLGKRKAREQYEDEQERKKRVNAKLPVRKLDGDVSDEPDSSDEDLDDLDDDDKDEGMDDDDDAEDYRQDSEPEGLLSSDEDVHPASSRAIHAPLPRAARPTDDSDDEPSATTSAPTAPLSSITHSSRFNLTAPYEILLTSHTCRLPPTPPTSNRKATLAYRTTLANAQKQTLLLARNQIASLASQIVADPEVNLGLLRRLAVFAAPTISAPPEKIPEIRAEQAEAKAAGNAAAARPVKVEVAPAIRQLAMLSMLAVFVDILPGYRIRSLSEKEQEEKVGQDVARRREFEAGLVGVYREFLELCEAELKAASALLAGQEPEKGKKKPAPGVGKLEKPAVKVFTTLATRAVHFNFRTNILGVVVARMSRRQWGPDEEACFEAIQSVILSDLTGEVSLEVVRLVHRMTKERRYKVNSRVLDLLLSLRLRDELGNKRSSTTASTDPEAEAAKERADYEARRALMKAREGKKGGGKGAKSKDVRKGLATHLSKKQVKKQKELKAIEDEMKEAEATVDLEERERNQTETLKLVFVLYFTVLKREVGSVGLGVLESTLRGLSMYAHRVNVDFFRDLLAVLRQHVAINARLLEEADQAGLAPTEEDSDSEAEGDEGDNVLLDQTTLTRTLRHIILALKTTFDLFLGQVEGTLLNLDLTDLLSHFYYVLFYLPFVNESHLIAGANVVDLALDTLHAILIRSRTRFAPTILAAFAKRLAIISLHLPATSASGPRKVLGLISHLLTKQSTSASADSQLALLDLEDRSRNGSYQATGKNLNTSAVLESGQTILWELSMLTKMSNEEVSAEAERVWALKDSNQS